MQLRNTLNSYGFVSKCFHWLIAVLVIIMLCAGVSFNYLPKGKFASNLMFIHKSTGVTILVLMVLRLLWRFINPRPQFPENMKPGYQIAARWTHGLLYLTVILMPITGILMTLAGNYPLSFWGLFDIHLPFIPVNNFLKIVMRDWHRNLAWAIAFLVIIHVAAALKHHFINKDNILKRMWFTKE